jgi:hypothetical protein
MTIVSSLLGSEQAHCPRIQSAGAPPSQFPRNEKATPTPRIAKPRERRAVYGTATQSRRIRESDLKPYGSAQAQLIRGSN